MALHGLPLRHSTSSWIKKPGPLPHRTDCVGRQLLVVNPATAAAGTWMTCLLCVSGLNTRFSATFVAIGIPTRARAAPLGAGTLWCSTGLMWQPAVDRRCRGGIGAARRYCRCRRPQLATGSHPQLTKRSHLQPTTCSRSQLTTGGMFSELKADLRRRDAAGWARVKWEMRRAPALNELEVVHGRLIYLNPKASNACNASLAFQRPRCVG